MFTLKSVTWLALILCHGSQAARILAVVPTPSYSHQLAYRPLWKELSLKGHQVVLLTTDPMNDPSLTNLTEIDMHGSYKVLSEVNFNDIFILSESFAPFTMMQKILDFGINLADYQYGLEEVQSLIKEKKFDLVIGEYLQPFPLSFGEWFDCPVIAITSMDAISVLHSKMGNPTNPIIYPSQDIAYSMPTTFQERLYQITFRWIFEYYISIGARATFRLLSEFYNKTFPSHEDMMKRIQVTFINSNPILYPTRPLTPATVNTFGLHILKAKPLPQDLQQFLDHATEGAIFISFGTNVNNKELSETNIFKVFLKTFSDLPYKIIWKMGGNNSHISSNKIMIRKWYPQRDLLAHKNVKLFITQGGLQSMEEALHCRVPMIGIPFLGDQFNNVLRAQDKGIGRVIFKKDLTEDLLKETVLQIIEEPRYKKRITELADIIEDTPMTALESAVWWTEYVLRHKGKDLSHLKGATTRVNLNEYYMLDVIVFSAFVVLAIFFIVFWIVHVAMKVFSKIYSCKSKQEKIKKLL